MSRLICRKEMRLQLEMKEMEIHNRDQKIQELQNHIVSLLEWHDE